MAEPAISVVVPTFGRPGELRTCLQGFRDQQEAPPFEIVIVDDGSPEPLDDIVAPFAGDLDLRLERRPHRGVAAARNVGVVLARAPLLLLFDDDQRPLPHLVRRCVDFHAAEPDEGTFRLLRLVPDPAVPRSVCSMAMFERGCVFNYPQPGQDWRHGGFWGGAVTCKASIFRYGLYDPAYGMAEDTELGLRIGRWLELSCRYDGVPDAIQLREPRVDGIARRWLRMSYFHLIWQRNYGAAIDVGQQPAYRDAPRILEAAPPLTEVVSRLAAEADALGRFDPATLDAARAVRLEDALLGMRAMMRQCQATGWLAARADEPLEAMLARVLPVADS